MKNKTLTMIGLGLAGVFGLLWFTRKDAAAVNPALPGPGHAQPPDGAGGTEEEAPPETPINAGQVAEGLDRLPRYSIAVTATPKGLVEFEKDIDPVMKTVRWVAPLDSGYGSYKDIVQLNANRPVISIHTGAGQVLWSNGALTPYGQRFFGLLPGAPLAALK